MSASDTPGQAAARTSEQSDLELWNACLDEYEQRLGVYEEVSQQGSPPPEGMWPPPELLKRPLPPELADRVRSLLERSNRVEGLLVAERSRMPTPTKAHVRYRRPPTSSSISKVL